MAASHDLSTPEQLIELYLDLDRALLGAANSKDAISAVTELALSVIPGVEEVSVSEGRQGRRFVTLAHTGPMAAEADQIQYQLTSGPCVDAILEDAVFRTGDLPSDSRWPGFAVRAHAETGVRSMLSLRLFIEDDDRIAGLNLYSRQPDAFDDNAQVIATVLATRSALVLTASAARARAVHLERALASNRQVGMAMGILMAGHKITPDDAFVLLRVASQHSNRKLIDIADDVVTTGMLELPTPKKPTQRREPKAPKALPRHAKGSR